MGGVTWRRRRLVRLHLEGQSFSVEGVLLEVTGKHYRLANVSHLEAEERSHALEGEVWVPRERVLYCQVIG